MRYSSGCSLLVLTFSFSSALCAQGTFMGLGARETYVSGISGDGTIVVGARGQFGPVFRWTAETGVVNIGAVSASAQISRDGKVIVADDKDANGISSSAIWQGGNLWRTLGGLPNGRVVDNTLTSTYGINGDGSVIVGLGWVNPTGSHAVKWDAQNGWTDLGSLQGRSSRANGISADGNAIVGWDENPKQETHDYWRGAIWWQGLERLMNPYGWIGQSWAANNVGSIIVGRGHPMNTQHAYRFTAWDGHVEDLGSIPRGRTPSEREQEDKSIAFAVSDDGNVVLGYSGWQPPTDAFIWTPETKMMKVSDYLTSKGITGFQNWILVSVLAVTPDGKTIAGTGINPDGFVEGWMAKLP